MWYFSLRSQEKRNGWFCVSVWWNYTFYPCSTRFLFARNLLQLLFGLWAHRLTYGVVDGSDLIVCTRRFFFAILQPILVAHEWTIKTKNRLFQNWKERAVSSRAFRQKENKIITDYICNRNEQFFCSHSRKMQLGCKSICELDWPPLSTPQRNAKRAPVNTKFRHQCVLSDGKPLMHFEVIKKNWCNCLSGGNKLNSKRSTVPFMWTLRWHSAFFFLFLVPFLCTRHKCHE